MASMVATEALTSVVTVAKARLVKKAYRPGRSAYQAEMLVAPNLRWARAIGFGLAQSEQHLVRKAKRFAWAGLVFLLSLLDSAVRAKLPCCYFAPTRSWKWRTWRICVSQKGFPWSITCRSIPIITGRRSVLFPGCATPAGSVSLACSTMRGRHGKLRRRVKDLVIMSSITKPCAISSSVPWHS